MILAQTLHKLKTKTGFNITELAEFTGVSRKTVSRILRHRTNRSSNYSPAYSTVSSIAKSLQTNSDDLINHKMDIEIQN